jgi:hypothetical protein
LGISEFRNQEGEMKLVHARFYTYDFTRLVAMIAFILAIAVNCLFGPFRKHSIGADHACIRSMKLESIVDRHWECRAIARSRQVIPTLALQASKMDSTSEEFVGS